MLAVFFGWKRRPFWGIGPVCPSWSLRSILSWARVEVFPADKQLVSPDSQLEPTAASNCGGASLG